MARITVAATTPNTFAVGDYNNDGKDDLAFTTDNGLADVMLAASGGSLGAATSLPMPAGYLAIGLTKVDYNTDGKTDLIVQVDNTNIHEFPGYGYDDTIVGLNLYTGNGAGSFASTSAYLTTGHPDLDTLGIVAGCFQRPRQRSGGGGPRCLRVIHRRTSRSCRCRRQEPGVRGIC